MSAMVWDNGKYREPTKAEAAFLETLGDIDIKPFLEDIPQMIEDKITAAVDSLNPLQITK